MFTTVTYTTRQEPETVRTAVIPDGEFYADWIAQRDNLDHPNDVTVHTIDQQHPLYRVSAEQQGRRFIVGYIAYQPDTGQWLGRHVGSGVWTRCATLPSAIRQTKRRGLGANVEITEVTR
jgi:hypothetical protein